MGSLLLAAGAPESGCAAEFAHHDPSALGRRPRAGDRHRDPGARDSDAAGATERDYLRRTGQPLEVIQTAVERDKFLSPLEAKEFGLVDEVVEARPSREERGFRPDSRGGS